MSYSTREEWLTAAIAELRPLLTELPEVKVSIGFPRRVRKAIGQCFPPTYSDDQSTYHIFISPTIVEPRQVLATLLHELVHASVGCECGHRGEFAKTAKRLGFKAALSTQEGWSAELDQQLTGVLEKLGAWPSVALNPKDQKKQTTRNLLYTCPDCGVKIRHAGVELHARCLDCQEDFQLQVPD